MSGIGQYFTAHLTQGLTSHESSAYETDSRLRAFCQRLMSVSNAGVHYNGIVSNNAHRSIDGNLLKVDNLSDEIVLSEKKIISRIRMIKSGDGSATAHSVTQERIEKNIRHLEKRINQSFRQVSTLSTPAQRTVPAHASNDLNRFRSAKDDLIGFVKNSLPPSYDSVVDSSDDSLPSYNEAVGKRV